ncbi:hypothetical protein AOC23_06045 [Polynucleobacter paneuropaeus]|uniref:hypothetical protein n=1 Tax=Polynucleobacter paneuropaeus TaxID=2527775 RepID=UPI001BFD0F35|nr:hypothetical protein [Polynucleobacter paneuropaeus]MBT8631631.1 hypothetical protein [Polynucleobacter paneuropaeus]
MTRAEREVIKRRNDKRVVILNTLKGEDEPPYHRRGKLLANTPYEPPPLHELAQVFKGWLSHNL